jgi:hypothetical protein
LRFEGKSEGEIKAGAEEQQEKNRPKEGKEKTDAFPEITGGIFSAKPPKIRRARAR